MFDYPHFCIISIVYIGAILSPFSLAVSYVVVLGEGNIEIVPQRDRWRAGSPDMDNFIKHNYPERIILSNIIILIWIIFSNIIISSSQQGGLAHGTEDPDGKFD